MSDENVESELRLANSELNKKIALLEEKVLEKERAEKSIQDSEKRYRRLFESAKDGILILDADTGQVVDVNPYLLQLLGYSYDELFGKHIWEIVGLKDIAASIEAFKILQDNEYIRYEDLPLETHDGQLVDVEFVSNLYLVDHSRVIQCNIRNITERKRAEEKLIQTNSLLDMIVENIPNMIFLKDARELRFVRLNRAGEELLGFSRDNIIGKNDHDFFPKEQADFFKEKDREVLSGKTVVDIPEEPLQSRSKGLRTMHTKKVPVLGANGKPEYLLGISEDITERKQDEAEKTKLQAQLRQAQKMEAVGLLAGGVAHDFNNLLTIINGLAEISISELSPLDPLLPRLQGIRDAGNRAANLTRQLLAFARQQVVCPRALDLNETIGSMEKMLHRLIGEDIEFVWKPGTDIWCIYLDPSQVDQILANLVINARDAIPGVGTITIETSNTVIDEVYCATHVGTLPGEYAMLEITDTGVGMNHETLSRIFEPFFTTKEFGKGTGLGLATVYGIVKQAGGSIYAYSEPGQGTIMRIYLPRWYGGIAAAVIRDDLPKSLQGTETVLLVEDEERVLDVGREILKRQGYRVITALTPGEALLAAEKEPGTIHLLATDVVMPSMNGRELYERLQVQRPKLKCLYLSGYPSDAITQRGVLPEGVHFLQKPYSLKGLIAKVRAVLDEK